MTNGEIAEVFERMALILDLKGDENPFRVRAYERAASSIANLSKDLKDTYQEGGIRQLEALPGIGKDLSHKIEELIMTQKLTALSDLEKRIPKGIFDIMEIEGMGPKKTKFVWQTFNVHTIAALQKLAKSGTLSSLKGWGEKSVENILKGIELRKKMAGRLPLHRALLLAMEIVDVLKNSGLCLKVDIAGSLRRMKETVGDIDILVVSTQPRQVMDLFCSLPSVERVTAQGKTKSSVFLSSGVDADVRVVAEDVFGAALHYFTGSKAHNVRIRKMGIAKGITISEYGVFEGTARNKGKRIAAKTEKDIFRSVGLDFIPPELREDRGEIEAAKRSTLPTLIDERDIKGDLHLHTSFSDGRDSVLDMVHAAKDAGLTYIAITDHASPMGMVQGIKKNNLSEYLQLIWEAKKRITGIHILAGCEVDILEDGSLYLHDDALKEFDVVVAAVHQHMKQPREKATQRLKMALINPYVSILGHPLTRKIGKREGLDVDMEEVLQEAKKQKKAVECNASPDRLDLPDIHLRRAKELNVPICINSDSHSVHGFQYFFGISQARRGWLEKDDVLNTRSWSQLQSFLTRSQ